MKEKTITKQSQAIKAIQKQKNTDNVLEFLEKNWYKDELKKSISKLNKDLLSKLHKYDLHKNDDLIKFTRNTFYRENLSEGTIYSNQINNCNTSERLTDFIRSHKYMCDTSEKENYLLSLLKETNFAITDENKDLLWESPVVLHYFLSNPNIPQEDKTLMLMDTPNLKYNRVLSPEDKNYEELKNVELPKSKFLSFAPEAASDELLEKIGEDMRKLYAPSINTSPSENNAYLKWSTNMYIALAGLKNGDLPAETFNQYCLKSMDFPEKNISMKNLRTALETLKSAGVISQISNTDVSKFITIDNGINYSNPHELENLMEIIKTFNINPFLIDPSIIWGYRNEFKQAGLITEEEFETIAQPIGYSKTYKESFQNDESDSELLDRLHYDPRPSSYKEAILMMHKNNKKINELSLAEADIFIIYTKKILAENGIENSYIHFSYDGLVKGSNGTTKTGKNEIHFAPNGNTVKALMQTIFHETNHLIQAKRSKEMNIDTDTDLIEFAQDALMRFIDKEYYDTNYWNISTEFDADFSAYIQTSDFFSESPDKMFEETLEKYNELNIYQKTNKRYTKEDGFIRLNTLFSSKLAELHDNNPIMYGALVKIIQEDYPILSYEYDLDTGRPISIENLVDDINLLDVESDPEVTNIIRRCKYILNARCSPDKVGDIMADYYRERLKNKLSGITPEQNKLKEIEVCKDKFEKYQNIFNELKENLNKQTAKASR